MNPEIKVSVEALLETNLCRRFSIAFVFMSLLPIILLLFIIYHLKITPLLEEQLPYFRLTILLVVLAALASFDLIRRSLIELRQFDIYAREIANGEYHKRLEIKEENELGRLAESFNKITDELEGKIKELQSSKKLLQKILGKIGTAVTSTRGIDELLELIIQTLTQGVDAASAAIFLTDETASVLTVKASFGIDEELKRIRIDPKEGIIGRVIRLKKAEVVSNVSTNIAARFEFKSGLAKDSIMVVPLLYRDKTLGTILISDKEKGAFNNDDIALLMHVAAQTAIAIENFQLNEDAEKTYLETITALAVAVEAKDYYSRGHLERVRDYVERLARHMQLDNEMVKVLKNGSVLHDIGKIGIRDEILKKKTPLTEGEIREIKKHVLIGVNIIKPIRSMSALCDLVRHHQEQYDGKGYPDGLKGEEIPLTARILKICDTYDAMTTDRSYRKAMNREDAKEELIKKSGTEFDPQIVKEFLEIL